MTLDLKALRSKLNELEGNKSKSAVQWKPSEGENRVRIVPLASSPDNPFIELYFHYLGGKTYLSPRSFGESDPIAEFGESLRAGGGLSKEEWRETKKFIPVRRTFVPIIDRGNPNAGVRFWAFGKTVYSDLLSTIADPEYGDITDPKSGRDIKVIFTPQEKSDTDFAKTTLRVSPSQSPLSTNHEEVKKWLTEQPDLYSIYERFSYDDLKDILDKFVNGGSAPASSASSNDSDGWDDAPSPTTTKSSVGKKEASNIDEEFDKMFKDN